MRTTPLLLALLMTWTCAAAAAEGANDIGLKVTATVKKQNDRWLILAVTLDNTGGGAIQFKNAEGEKIGGFRARTGERETAADAGKFKWTKAAGAMLLELEAGMKTDLELKFRWEPELPAETYDWKLIVTNLFVDGKKVEDVEVRSKDE